SEQRISEREAERATDEAQEKAFDPKLPKNRAARAPKRETSRDLWGTSGDPDEGETGEVGAGDEQDHTNGGHESQYRISNVVGKVVRQRRNVEPSAAVF